MKAGISRSVHDMRKSEKEQFGKLSVVEQMICVRK